MRHTALDLGTLLATLALPGRHLSTLLMLSQLARLHDMIARKERSSGEVVVARVVPE